MTCCCSRNGRLACGLISGFALVITGVIILCVGNKLVKDVVKKEALLVNGTMAFDNWIGTSNDFYEQFFVFTVVNYLEVTNEQATPYLRQMGPYTYRIKYLPKTNVTFDDNILSYTQFNEATFIPELSQGTEDDIITTLNLAAVIAPVILHGKVPNALISIFFKALNIQLFQNRTVRELLWGYEDKILKHFHVSDPTIGLFYPYNGTTNGGMSIYTGEKDINNVGMIYKWAEKTSVPYWNDTYCDMINGTEATSFPPFVKKHQTLYFFSSDICRSIFAKYHSMKYIRKIRAFSFVVPEEAMAAAQNYPNNYCYCKSHEAFLKNCTKAGVLDISPCKGLPIYMSLPHFLFADEEYRRDVYGMNPNFEEHKTHLDVEPVSGITISYAKRLQINLRLQPFPDITLLNLSKDILFPMVWLNETATINEEDAKKINDSMNIPLSIITFLEFILMILGVLIILLSLFCYMVFPGHKDDMEDKLVNDHYRNSIPM
uniref:Platelet glycoprotein 4 n=1 Tax=Eptatretus burgeri TaxID=7764 RepID=A0A8C4N4Z6_EPTBU